MEKDLQGCQVQLLILQVRNSAQEEQVTYPRSLQLDGGRFDTDNLASLSLKMRGPQAGQDVTERHMGEHPALAGLIASKKTFCCNPDDEIKLATNWLIGSKLCEAVRHTLSWSKTRTFS